MRNIIFGDRFSKIVDLLKISRKVNKEQIAHSFEMASSSLYRLIGGETPPKVELIEKLITMGINPDFLTHGTEPIFLETPSLVDPKEVFDLMNKRLLLDYDSFSDENTVPFVNISAMAGYRIFVQDEKENFERIKVPHNVKSKVDYAFEIEGDSMQPIINNNAVAYCRKVDTGEEIQFFLATTRKRIYVICTENQLFVKFLVKDSEGKLYLESANDDYPRVAIDLSQIKLLFRVEGVSNVF